MGVEGAVLVEVAHPLNVADHGEFEYLRVIYCAHPFVVAGLLCCVASNQDSGVALGRKNLGFVALYFYNAFRTFTE